MLTRYFDGAVQLAWAVFASGSMMTIAGAGIYAVWTDPMIIIAELLGILSWLIQYFLNYFNAGIGFTPATTIAGNPIVQLAIAGLAQLNVILPISEACKLGLFLIAAKFFAAAIVSIRRFIGTVADQGVIASNS